MAKGNEVPDEMVA
jgi:hypothetical protein